MESGFSDAGRRKKQAVARRSSWPPDHGANIARRQGIVAALAHIVTWRGLYSSGSRWRRCFAEQVLGAVIAKPFGVPAKLPDGGSRLARNLGGCDLPQ